jgi:hypothetical protein
VCLAIEQNGCTRQTQSVAKGIEITFYCASQGIVYDTPLIEGSTFSLKLLILMQDLRPGRR